MKSKLEIIRGICASRQLNLRRLAEIALFAVMLAAAANAASTPKRVLLVYQNDGYGPAGLRFQQSVLATLQKALGQGIEFYCEQLDSTRLPKFREQALVWLRSRYVGYHIGAVIFMGSVPTDILPDVPVVYVGNSPFEFVNNSSNRANFAAVWYRVDLKKTISMARRLQPKANKVLIITGSGFDDHVFLPQARDQLKGIDIAVEYLADATVEELKAQVSHLPRETIVLPISYSRDRNGNNYYPRDVTALLSQVSSAPIYTVADTVVGVGTVGGYVADFTKTGEVTADAVLQLLAGKPASQVSIPPEGTGSYVVDWRELERWGFRERDLPAGSVVRFRSVNVWEQYRWRIVGTLSLVVAQFFLILRLLVTQRKRAAAEAALRDMSGRLLASQDEERRRFARDLHDGTGQHLSALTLAIGQVLTKFPPGYEGLRKLLQDSHSTSRQALDEVRTVSFALHPPMLEGLGLAAAVRWYLSGLAKRTAQKIDFDSSVFDASVKTKLLGPEVERALFRVVQESVGNALRHSGGENIGVVLATSERGVILEIKDDGHGMSAEQLAQAKGAATMGVGISGMRERLSQLNGTFEIQSGVDGTKIITTVPVLQERFAAHSIS